VTIGAGRLDECQACVFLHNSAKKPCPQEPLQKPNAVSASSLEFTDPAGAEALPELHLGSPPALKTPDLSGSGGPALIPTNWDNLPTKRVTYPTGAARSFAGMILRKEAR